MAKEQELFRQTLGARIRREANRPGEAHTGHQGAPGNRSTGPVQDISSAFGMVGLNLTGFAMTGGDDGGFETNPGGA